MVSPDEVRKAMNTIKRKDRRFKSQLYDPNYSAYARGIMSNEKRYSMQLFRRIAEKAWLLNTVIGHIIDKTIPYMRPLSEKGKRGFAIELKDEEAKATAADKKKAKEIEAFILATNSPKISGDKAISRGHEDNLVTYTKKLLRDLLTLDQTATEKLWTRGGELIAFEAVDAATIIRCNEEGYDGDDDIRFVQIIRNQIDAQYADHQMLFQFQNPRTDVMHYGYGYSKIEQCVDLIVSLINSFNYNAGSFTEDNLPRRMLLINGDIGFEEIEEMEDYIIDVMSPGGVGGAVSKWGIPIIPSGQSGGDKSSIQWQPMGSTNKDMEYSRWQDTLYMAIGSVYGIDMESMGIKSLNSAKIIDSGSLEGKKYSDDKGIGNALMFLSQHFQNFVDNIDPRFKIVFHGFEQDDAKESREAISDELSSFKSLNEIRKENDKKEFDAKWADVPGLQNDSYRQAWMAENGMDQQGQEGEPGADEFGDEFGDFGKSIKEDVVRITI